MRKIMSAVARRLFPPSESIEGYDHPELLEVIFRKTVAYDPSSAWPDIEGVSSVLDFGGGCGRHYKEAMSPTIRWAIVETPAMVDRAKDLSTDRLKFFETISDAVNWLGRIDMVHSDGALQFVPSPEETLKKLCDLAARQMLWRRLFLSESARHDIQTSFLSDNGPGHIRVKEKLVRYSRTAITEQQFVNAHAGYAIKHRGEDSFHFVYQSTRRR